MAKIFFIGLIAGVCFVSPASSGNGSSDEEYTSVMIEFAVCKNLGIVIRRKLGSYTQDGETHPVDVFIAMIHPSGRQILYGRDREYADYSIIKVRMIDGEMMVDGEILSPEGRDKVAEICNGMR